MVEEQAVDAHSRCEVRHGREAHPFEQAAYRALLVAFQLDAAVNRLFKQLADAPVLAGVYRVEHRGELGVGFVRVPAERGVDAPRREQLFAPPRRPAGAIFGDAFLSVLNT